MDALVTMHTRASEQGWVWADWTVLFPCTHERASRGGCGQTGQSYSHAHTSERAGVGVVRLDSLIPMHTRASECG